MKIQKTLFLMSLMSVLFGCADKDRSTDLLNHISSDVILSGYQHLYQSANVLYAQSLVCKQDEVLHDNIIEAMKLDWKDTMKQWQMVQWVQFGPIKQKGREWSLQFWPDKKNLVGKKIKGLLQKQSILTYPQIESDGVVVQGLSAIEYLLFDQSLNDKLTSKQRCLSVIPVAKKIEGTSKELIADWDAYNRQNILHVSKPLPEAEILTAQQGISIIINNLVAFVDNTVDKKIVSPFSLNKENKKVNAYFLESWRSQTSRDNIKYNVLSIKALFLQGGVKDLLDENDSSTLGKNIIEELDSIVFYLEKNQSFDSFFTQILEDEKVSVKNIQPLYQSLERLRAMIRHDLTQALNIQIGFNASDGDS